MATLVQDGSRGADREVRRFELGPSRPIVENDATPASASRSISTRRRSIVFQGMVGRSPAMHRLYRTIARVAPTRATVLVTGETGTGKELVAHAIHSMSDRARRRFVAVNCGAIPATLLDSELFGHERGAFTGAIQSRRGWIETAAGGTLFLDEISTLSQDIQVKLLRVIQERVIHRVGSRAPVNVDFRLVAATNRDLASLVDQGRFREDLYYRLNVFPIRIPPLRERLEDLPVLVEHLRGRLSEELGLDAPEIGGDLLVRMLDYDWPGTVRELETFIERCLSLGDVEADPGPDPFLSPGEALGAVFDRALGEQWTLDRLEREYLLSTLSRTGGSQAEAARRLGVNRGTICRRLKRYREEGWVH